MPRTSLVASLVVVAVVLAACDGSTPTETTDETGTTVSGPTTTAAETDADTTTTSPGTTTSAEDVEEVVELTLTPADGWTAISLGRGVKPVIALDPNGAPAVAWILERVNEGFIAYASAAEEWNMELTLEGYFYGPIDLDFTADGQPNIAIHDHQADDFNPQLGDLVRIFLDDDEWVADTAQDQGHDGWDSTIAIGDDGVIHAAGVDPAQFGRTEGVEYYRNAGDSWEVTQLGTGPISYQYNVGLDLDPSGSPAITYYDDVDQDLVFASLVDGSWVLERVVEEGNVGKYSSLAFSPDGNPAISFFDQLSETEGEILYAVRDGETWSVETVGEVAAFSERNARRNSSLAFDGQGQAHVVFSDTTGVWYSVKTDDGWETVQIVTGDLPLGQLVSLALDAEDQPHLALYEVTNELSLDGVVAYLTRG